MHKRSLALVSLLLLAPSAAHAVGETNGRIAGQITEDRTNVPIAGAKVLVSSKSLIGRTRSIVTDDEGRYELVELPPGTYDIEVSYEGTKPIRRRVSVRQGETAPVNIKWSIELTEQKATVIVEEVHMTKPDTTQTGTVLTADTQSKVASGRRYQDVVQQVAGVSGDPQQGNPNIKGASLLNNRYLVDGLDITDPVTNTFSSNINFDSIASIDVLTGGMEAQYNALGGVINLITKGGSDTWTVDTSFYVNNARLSGEGQYGPSPFNGPRPFSQIASAPTQTYQANLNLGGPLVKSKLWFNFSFEYKYQQFGTPAGPPLNVQHPSRLDNRFLMRLKLTWAPSEKHRITWSTSADPAFFNNVDQSNAELGVAENYQDQGGLFSILQWDYFASPKINSSVQAGFQWSFINFGPQGFFSTVDTAAYRTTGKFSAENNVYDPNRPQHFNNDDGTTWYQGSQIFRDTRWTGQFDPSISVRGKWLGSHDAKFGVQSRFVYHTQSVQTPGGSAFNDAGGGAGEGGLCFPEQGRTAGCFQRVDTPDYRNHQWGVGVGLYAQDRWKPVSWLTILPGVRFDYGHTVNSLGQVVSNLYGFGPRIGTIVDITRDQKTLFTAFYGRANETLSLLTASTADVVGISRTSQWNPTTKRFEFLQQSGGAGGYLIDPGATAPHSDEVTLSLRREIVANSVATIDYTYKRLSNVWDGIEVNQIWDPTGTRVVGYANGAAQQVFLYTTPDANYRNYHGVDFIFESSPRKNWDLMAVYTLSWLYGPGAEQLGQITGQTSSQFYNNRQYNQFDGFLPEDRRHQLKIRTSYTYGGLTLGANLQFITGAPLTKRFFNQTDGGYTVRRTPQGTEPTDARNDPNGIAEFRTPDLFVLDVRVMYDFHGLIGQHVILMADLFNAFNLRNPANSGFSATSAFETRDLPTFGSVLSRQDPFRAQFGVRYQY